jgi:hypothetical protein
MEHMTTRTRASAIKATLTRQEFKRLEALFQATALVREMEQADRLLIKFVGEARKQGATWQEVATALGITQQGATKRFSPLLEGKRRQPPARTPRLPVKHEVQQSLAV